MNWPHGKMGFLTIHILSLAATKLPQQDAIQVSDEPRLEMHTSILLFISFLSKRCLMDKRQEEHL